MVEKVFKPLVLRGNGDSPPPAINTTGSFTGRIGQANETREVMDREGKARAEEMAKEMEGKAIPTYEAGKELFNARMGPRVEYEKESYRVWMERIETFSGIEAKKPSDWLEVLVDSMEFSAVLSKDYLGGELAVKLNALQGMLGVAEYAANQAGYKDLSGEDARCYIAELLFGGGQIVDEPRQFAKDLLAELNEIVKSFFPKAPGGTALRSRDASIDALTR